jgi:hypothetical protein
LKPVTPHLKIRSRKKKVITKKTRKFSRKASDNSGFVAPSAPPKVDAPTDAEIRKILRDDTGTFGESQCHFVRRSSRQPSKSILNSASVRDLLDKLKCNDSDMVVLKLKQYLNDPDIPSVIMDATFDALEENTNCQALYIQVRIAICWNTIFSMRLYALLLFSFFLKSFTSAFFIEL